MFSAQVMPLFSHTIDVEARVVNIDFESSSIFLPSMESCSQQLLTDYTSSPVYKRVPNNSHSNDVPHEALPPYVLSQLVHHPQPQNANILGYSLPNSVLHGILPGQTPYRGLAMRSEEQTMGVH